MDKSRNRSRSTLRNNFGSLPTDPRLRRHSPPVDQQLRSYSPPTDPRLRKNVHTQRIQENYQEKPNFNREIKKELEEEQKKPMANATSSFHIPVIRDPVMKFEDTEQSMGINQGTLAKGSSIRSESPEPEVPRMTMEQIKALDFTWTEKETEKECPLCKITCTGQIPWEEHLKGKKHHWYKQKALGRNPRPLEKNLIYYAKNRNPYRPYDFDPKERPIEQFKEIYGIMSKVFRCEMCDMDATDIEIYKQHIAGRKHKRMLIEDKFTGNNILKDICGYEECCEDLKKACAACGNTIWWGQCGHAMHQLKMICILVLGIFVVVNAVLPPAHQPKLDIPGASSRGTGFSANELYGAGGTKNYPLPDCFTNESGFMCCNAELLDEMHKAYDDLRNRPEWISCNIQAITNSVQKRAEARFGLPFEVITGISDFASKAHFYHNFICKFEREGRIILAYATPRNGGDLQKLASAGIPGVGGKAELAAPAENGGAGAQSAPSGGASAAAGGAGAQSAPSGGASAAAGGAGAQSAPSGGASAATGGAGDQATPSGGANAATVGVGSLPVGPQGSSLAAAPSGGSAGVGGFGASGDLGSASAAAAPRGGQEGNAGGANAGVGGSSQGGNLAAPYRLTKISV